MTAIAISYKRKKIAQLNLSYDTASPTSLSLAQLSVEVASASEDILADFAYYLTSFPAGKVFVDLSRLSPQSTNHQSISYEDIITILGAFPEGWTYQATEPPSLVKPDDLGDEMHQQFGAMIY